MQNGKPTNIVLSDALLAGFASLLLVWLVAVSRIPLEPPRPGTDFQNRIYALSLLATAPADVSNAFSIEDHLGCIVFDDSNHTNKVHARFLGIGARANETGAVAWPSSSTSIEGRPSLVFSLEDGIDADQVSMVVFLRDHTDVCAHDVLSDLNLTLILKDLGASRVIKEFSLSKDNSFASTISLNQSTPGTADGREHLVSDSLRDIVETHKSDLTPSIWDDNGMAQWRHPVGLEFPLEHFTSRRQRSLILPDSTLGVVFIDDLPNALPASQSILLGNLLLHTDIAVVREPIIVGSKGASALELVGSTITWKVITPNDTKPTAINVPSANERFLHGVSIEDACSLAALSTMSGFGSKDHETGAFYQNPILFFWPANSQ